MTLLVTGFGPFPGMPQNPTTTLIEEVAAHALPGVKTRLLPTTWKGCEAIPALAAEADMVLMFGVAGSARRIRYERVSRPTASPSADADGQHPHASPQRSRRPHFDVTDLVLRARRAGFPVIASDNAGGYICNAAYGAALTAQPRTLFVHVPIPSQRGPLSALGLERHALWLVKALTAQPVRRSRPLS